MPTTMVINPDSDLTALSDIQYLPRPILSHTEHYVNCCYVSEMRLQKRDATECVSAYFNDCSHDLFS